MKNEQPVKREGFKKLISNRKVLLGISSILICVALIAVCSFVPFIIDPTRWQTVEFLTDELIIIAIIISSMISMMFVSQASNAQDERSELAKARAKFFGSIVQITNVNGFKQWVKKVLQPKDIQAIKERKLKELGIDDFKILLLEDKEIKSLLNSPQAFNIRIGVEQYEKRYFKGLTKEQVKEVLKIKNKKQKLRLVEPDYYLSVKNLIDNRTITERSSTEGTKKSLYLVRSVVSKIILSLVTGMIFASLIRDLTASSDIGTALQKFVSRIWSLISSGFMGYLVGVQINNIDAEYIEMRILVHHMYLEDKDFVPLTQQEEAKQAFADRVAQENILAIEEKPKIE